MKKEDRVKKSLEIEKIVKHKNSVGNKFFVIYKKENKSKFRAAISVSKKYGNAVKRNQAKRRVRAILTELNYNEFKSFDVLIVIKPNSSDLPYLKMKEQLTYLIKKHKLRGEN